MSQLVTLAIAWGRRSRLLPWSRTPPRLVSADGNRLKAEMTLDCLEREYFRPRSDGELTTEDGFGKERP